MLHRLFIVADKRDVARTQFWEVSPEWPAAIAPIRLAIEASERGAHALPRGLNRSDDSIALRGGIDMFRGIATLTLSFCLAAVATPAALADNGAPITEQEAHAIGVDAYVYLYPLITMDITRRQLTNTDKGFGRGPMCSPRQAGARRARRREPSSLRRRAGGRTFATASSMNSGCRKPPSGSMRRRPMSGSSGAQRPMGLRITRRFGKFRPASQSLCSLNGVSPPSRPNSRSIPPST